MIPTKGVQVAKILYLRNILIHGLRGNYGHGKLKQFYLSLMST